MGQSTGNVARYDRLRAEMGCQALFSGLYASSRDDLKPFPPAEELVKKFSRKHKTRVLVVDDERLIADTLSEILNHSGFDAVPAYNGNAAMAVIEQDCPDIVISDVIMPGINGVDLAKYVSDTCSDTRVFLLSGQAATSDLLDRARKLGYSFELLAKPLRPELLIEKLRR
jgi:DNA-binding NtrC family response regulator